jgi:hypothetical protein
MRLKNDPDIAYNISDTFTPRNKHKYRVDIHKQNQQVFTRDTIINAQKRNSHATVDLEPSSGNKSSEMTGQTSHLI